MGYLYLTSDNQIKKKYLFFYSNQKENFNYIILYYIKTPYTATV